MEPADDVSGEQLFELVRADAAFGNHFRGSNPMCYPRGVQGPRDGGHGPGTTRFRRATPTDVDGIVVLMRAFYADDGHSFVESEARAALGRLVAEPARGGLWVAERAGEIAAYLAVTLGYSLEYRGLDAFVDEVVVAEGHRGGGLGRDALTVAEAYCRAAGVRALHLEVELEKETALGLYRRWGFVDHRRRLMTKRLDD
jgi:ribosomal protein S18 acetylase RimI-like enzyme